MDISNNLNTKQAEEELSLIRKIMDDSRRSIIDNGWHYIYWGVIVTGTLIANYFMILSHASGNSQGMLWFITMVSASMIETIIGKRLSKNVKVKTFAGRLLSKLWSVSGICMFMLGFVGTITRAYDPIFIFPLISLVLGLTYYISGAIQQIKWLSWISIFWWAGSVMLFAFPSIHSVLIFAGMMICFQVIPGVLLFIRARKDSVLQTAK